MRKNRWGVGENGGDYKEGNDKMGVGEKYTQINYSNTTFAYSKANINGWLEDM